MQKAENEYNCKVLKYKDSKHVTVYMSTIKRTQSKNENTITSDIKKIQIVEDLQRDLQKRKGGKHSLETSINRSKNNLWRIARSNDWDLFITLTFDQKKYDSSDYDFVSKCASVYMNNLKKRYCKDLKYLLVPEFHKDKKHFHFHALLGNTNGLVLTDSGFCDKMGETIYNIDGWKYGFSTATKVKDNKRVTNYIGKYITKELMNNLKFKKRYYASRNVDLVEEEYYMIFPDELYTEFDPDSMTYLKTIDVNGFNQVKYIEIKI